MEKELFKMEEKEKLNDIAKKIVSEFKNIKISFVENKDIVNFFENKENAKSAQLEFFFEAVKNEN
jgi:hypothetical protein